MPYEKLADLPDEVKALPKHAQEIWMAAFNSAIEQYKDEEKAFGTAWAAVKKKYEKRDGRWVAKGGEHMDNWIAIFKTGKHTDSAGIERDWNVGDLDEIISQYKPGEHEAPVVIGHPADNAPAYGWVEALKREGEILYARFKNLVPEFVDMVKRGLFKKRSIALYPDLTLRHVGFLGAMPPAVKGLPDVNFEHGQVPMIIEYAATGSIELAAGDEEKEAQEARSKKYNIGIKEGGHVTKPSEWDDVSDDDFLDPVNYRYPCPDADQTRAAASYWGKPKNQAQYSSEERGIINRRLEAKKKKFKIGEFAPKKSGGAAMSVKERFKNIFAKGLESLPDDDPLLQDEPPRTFTEAEVKAKEDAAAEKARKEEKERIEKEFAEKAKKARLDAKAGEVKTFIESLKEKGHVIPAWDKMGLSKFLESLDDEEGHQFAEEGDKISQLAFMRKFLEELPKVLPKGEFATKDKDIGGQGNAAEKLSKLTQEKMEKNKDLTYNQAFAEVQKENPELAKEYAQEFKAQA